MSIEQGIDYSTVLALAPIVVITISQARAIFNRDNHRCVFPAPHDCSGKLTVHHIRGKDDKPDNIVTVCHNAHWDHLHNGVSKEQTIVWQRELSLVAKERTSEAIQSGWVFPDK